MKYRLISDKMIRIKLNKYRFWRCLLKEVLFLSDFEINENELFDDENPAEAQGASKEENICEENAEPTKQEELIEELEGIRSKFQELLDETAETYLAGGDIQAYDDEEEQEKKDKEEISGEELCQCCGEKKRDTSFGEDYPYCADCRELMKHSPVSFFGVLALLCVLVLTGVSVYLFGLSNAEIANQALSAEAYTMSGKVYSAITEYSKILQPYASSSGLTASTPVPKKVAARYAQTYASLLNYSYANSVVEEFFSESDLKNPIYKKLSEYSEKNDCYSKIMEIINAALQDEKNGADEICAKLEEIRNDEGIDDFLIDYYKYIVVQYFGETAEKQYDILTSLIKKYPDKWPLSYELCAVCAKLGRVDEAQQNLSKVIKYNCEDGAIYAYLADAFRFCEEPDPDKMLEAVAEGEKADGDTGYAVTDLSRVKALAYLLKGDYDSAYDSASSAYQMAYSSLSYGYSVNNLSQCLYTYQLCAHLKGDKDAYDSVVAILGNTGIPESKDIKSFIKGTSSLEDIITNGEGDLA